VSEMPEQLFHVEIVRLKIYAVMREFGVAREL